LYEIFKPRKDAIMPKSNSKSTTAPIAHITQSILIVRGHKVILDRDLAAIYGVTTGRFNEAIKRNANRFPEDFMFQLTRAGAEASRSQIAILNSRGGNIKYLPFAFTEHGAIQAANVLNSPKAVEMGIYVVRAFVQLRDVLASNQALAQQLKALEARMTRKFAAHDHAINDIIKTIRHLMTPPELKKRSIGFVELEEKKSK
jgi:hypothetical protein